MKALVLFTVFLTVGYYFGCITGYSLAKTGRSIYGEREKTADSSSWIYKGEKK
jgi:hypothetical protein